VSLLVAGTGFEEIAPGCRRAVLPSPWPPGAVAVFLIEGEGPWLVDTGANTEESAEALRLALEDALGSDVSLEGAIVSHAHLDHAGGLAALRPPVTLAHFDAAVPLAADERLSRIGPIRTVDGEGGLMMYLEDWAWVLGEGHAPGHLLLWNPDSGSVLVGDQFFQGLKTPLRVADPDEDSFGDYLATIRRVAELEPSILFPSHTEAIREPLPYLERVERRMERQLDRTMAALVGGPRTAEQVTESVYRSLPRPGARQILLREQLAALRHLALTGEASRGTDEGVEVFEAG
jgi:glyoxylase-like metal-dependent hydrolase (beta-lactamase superfamily II)